MRAAVDEDADAVAIRPCAQRQQILFCVLKRRSYCDLLLLLRFVVTFFSIKFNKCSSHFHHLLPFYRFLAATAAVNIIIIMGVCCMQQNDHISTTRVTFLGVLFRERC